MLLKRNINIPFVTDTANDCKTQWWFQNFRTGDYLCSRKFQCGVWSQICQRRFIDFKWSESPATTKRHDPLIFRLILVSSFNKSVETDRDRDCGIDEGISILDHRHSVWTRMRQQASALQDPPEDQVTFPKSMRWEPSELSLLFIGLQTECFRHSHIPFQLSQFTWSRTTEYVQSITCFSLS